jgi:hypothetical protein
MRLWPHFAIPCVNSFTSAKREHARLDSPRNSIKRCSRSRDFLVEIISQSANSPNACKYAITARWNWLVEHSIGGRSARGSQWLIHRTLGVFLITLAAVTGPVTPQDWTTAWRARVGHIGLRLRRQRRGLQAHGYRGLRRGRRLAGRRQRIGRVPGQTGRRRGQQRTGKLDGQRPAGRHTWPTQYSLPNEPDFEIANPQGLWRQ